MSGEVELLIVLGAVMGAQGLILITLLLWPVYAWRGRQLRRARRRLAALESAGTRGNAEELMGTRGSS